MSLRGDKFWAMGCILKEIDFKENCTHYNGTALYFVRFYSFGAPPIHGVKLPLGVHNISAQLT